MSENQLGDLIEKIEQKKAELYQLITQANMLLSDVQQVLIDISDAGQPTLIVFKVMPGKLINAIKEIRSVLQLGLRESKELMEGGVIKLAQSKQVEAIRLCKALKPLCSEFDAQGVGKGLEVLF